jgi:hypothetical protein
VEADFDHAITAWRTSVGLNDDVARGVIALACRTARPQHALHFLAQLRTRATLTRNDEALREHLDAAGNTAARHPLTLGSWAARAIRVGFDTYLRRRLRLPTVAGGARIRCRCRPAKAQNDKAARNGTDVGQEGHEKHAMVCPLGPTARVPHDGAVLALWRAFRQLGLPASWEAANIAMDAQQHGTRRCDVQVHLANITYTIDVTRVHRPDTTLAQRRRLIRDAEKKKHDSYPPAEPRQGARPDCD